MKAAHLKTLTRFIGTIGVVGGLLGAGWGLRLYFGLTDIEILSRLGGALLFVVSCAVLRSAAIACFRWSPMAIRHAASVVFAVPTIYFSKVLLSRGELTLFLLAFCVWYAAYRFTSASLSARAFPARASTN